jgi:hypothetical protein
MAAAKAGAGGAAKRPAAGAKLPPPRSPSWRQKAVVAIYIYFIPVLVAANLAMLLSKWTAIPWLMWVAPAARGLAAADLCGSERPGAWRGPGGGNGQRIGQAAASEGLSDGALCAVAAIWYRQLLAWPRLRQAPAPRAGVLTAGARPLL